MAPTLSVCNGFEFQLLSSSVFAAGGTAMDSSTITNASIDTTNQRTGDACLLCAPTSIAAGQLGHTIAAANRLFSLSFYVKIGSSLPSSNLRIAFFIGPTNATSAPSLVFQQSSGKFAIGYGTALNGVQVIGPAIAADTWYLIDWLVDTSGATATMTARVNGDAASGATATNSQTAADLTNLRLGTDFATGPAASIYYDDLVYSLNVTDYPLGPHVVKLLKPTGDGTHNAGTNVIEDNAGADIGVVTAYNLVDEVPPENTDYIQQSLAGSGNYAEVTFADPGANDEVWGVTMWAAIENGISDMTIRTVDVSGNTLTDMGGTGAVASTRRYSAVPVAVPSGGTWTNVKLQGVKGRVGFATDVTPAPRVLTLVLQYAGRTDVFWDSAGSMIGG